MARLSVGMSMFGHGFIRLTKLTTFSNGMVASFQKSLLPDALVTPFSYALPFAEFGVGLLLLIGLFTKQACVAGGIVMIMLIFGTSMVEKWENIPSMLIHMAFFVVLLHFVGSNCYAVDNIRRK